MYGIEGINGLYLSNNLNLFQESLNLMSDDLSRDSFLAYLYGKVSFDWKYIVQYFVEPQYFQKDIVKLADDSVFIDCGAYNGDAIKSFIDYTKGNYLKIYAFEPDQKEFHQLRNYVINYNLQNIIVINKATGDKIGCVGFDQKTQSISDQSSISIETCCIDDYLLNENNKVSFIKMDIEGYELAALKGGSQIISRDKPILAISAYHKASDLITIPQFIKTIEPDYKLYFRLHKTLPGDAVLYAIC